MDSEFCPSQGNSGGLFQLVRPRVNGLAAYSGSSPSGCTGSLRNLPRGGGSGFGSEGVGSDSSGWSQPTGPAGAEVEARGLVGRVPEAPGGSPDGLHCEVRGLGPRLCHGCPSTRGPGPANGHDGRCLTRLGAWRAANDQHQRSPTSTHTASPPTVRLRGRRLAEPSPKTRPRDDQQPRRVV